MRRYSGCILYRCYRGRLIKIIVRFCLCFLDFAVVVVVVVVEDLDGDDCNC